MEFSVFFCCMIFVSMPVRIDFLTFILYFLVIIAQNITQIEGYCYIESIKQAGVKTTAKYDTKYLVALFLLHRHDQEFELKNSNIYNVHMKDDKKSSRAKYIF